jgi:hypothetical protein
MTVRIDEITTEVVATPDPAPSPATEAREGMDWQERVKAEALGALIRRDELRTRAHGYDD